MKSVTIELISTFRKKISFHSLLILLLLTAILILMIYLRTGPLKAGPFSEGLVSVLFLVLFFTGYFTFIRRKNYLKILDPADPVKSLNDFEKYFTTDYQLFRSTDIMRIVIGGILTLVLLLSVYYKPHTFFTGTVFGIWLGLILLSMMKGWMLMRDGMMLQDLKHARKDQTSEIS